MPSKSSHRFEILKDLGGGGMGQVFLAQDLQKNTRVALKFLHPGHGKQEQRHLQREVQLLSQLRHPNLVSLKDYFPQDSQLVASNPNSSSPFFSMEYVAGQTLGQATIPAEKALSYFVEICQGLHYLHSRQLLHRDLKPANVMVSTTGEIKLLDFGLANFETNRNLQNPTGTMAYLAPEAYWGEYHSTSDLYALGVLYYEVLSGKLPYTKPWTNFPAGNPSPEKLQKIRPELPEYFCDLIDQLISPAANKRPSSALALLRYLDQHSDSHYAEIAPEDLKLIFEKLPLIGRQQTLDKTNTAIHQAIQETTPISVTIQGPTGVGRSRLLDELIWHWRIQGISCEKVSPSSDFKKIKNWTSIKGIDSLHQNTNIYFFPDLHLWEESQWETLKAFWQLLQQQTTPARVVLEFNQDFLPNHPTLQAYLDKIENNLIIEIKPFNQKQSQQLMEAASFGLEIPDAWKPSILEHSQGRPLLLLENLKQAYYEIHSPHKNKTWQAPQSFHEINKIRMQRLHPELRQCLAHILVHPDPIDSEKLSQVLKLTDSLLSPILLELQAQQWIQGSTQSSVVQLSFPTLKEDYLSCITEQEKQNAHKNWLTFLLSQHDSPKAADQVAYWIAQHSLNTKQTKIFKTWGLLAADYLQRQNDPQKALQYYLQYEQLAATAQERYMVQAHLAPFYYSRGEYHQAIQAYDRWLADRDDDPSQLQKLKHRFYTGLAYFAAGQLTDANKQLLDSLAIGIADQYPQHRPYLTRTHLILGRICEKSDDFKMALEHFRKAAPLADTNPLLLGEVEINIGRLQRSLGKFTAARRNFSAAQQHYQQSGNIQAEAIAHHSLAMVAREQGELQTANQAIHESLALAEKSGNLSQWANYLANQALVLQDQGYYPEAQKSLARAKTIIVSLGKTEQKLVLKIQEIHQCFQLGNFLRGTQLLVALRKQKQTLIKEGLETSCLWLEAETAKQQKDYATAYRLFSKITSQAIAPSQHAERITASIESTFLEYFVGNHKKQVPSKSPPVWKQLKGKRFQLWQAIFNFLALPLEQRQQTKLLHLLKQIKDYENPDSQMQSYQLLARSLQQSGAHNIARRLQESAVIVWKKIYNSLSEELKMDYEKNRSLSGLEEELGQLLPQQNTPVTATNDNSTPSQGKTSISEMRFRQLTEINRQIGKKRNLEDILERVMDASIELTGAERGFLVLKKDGASIGPVDGFEIKTARHLNQGSLLEKDSQFSMTAVQQAINQGSFILTDNAQLDDRFQEQKSVMQFQLKAILTVPLEIEGEVLGAVYLDHRYQPGCFSEEDVVVLSAFAAQATLAIEKAQILAELNAAKIQLEEKVETQARHIEVLTGKLSQARDELRYEYDEIIGQSPAMMQVFQLLDHVTETTIPIWVKGESGTGKELIARSLHYNSPRSGGPFVSENCSSIPETLLESELFGHKKGAFTHADRDRMGLFEQANNGTLFLDEIGDMSLAMQAKLLRVLQEGEVRPVGSNKKVKVDIRLVTASHKDLNQMVRDNQFRQDLFYRVNGLTIALPALRERVEDIPILAKHLIAKAAKEFNLQASELTDDAYQVLYQYNWPGNIRELESTLRNALLFAKGRPISPEYLNLNPAIAGSHTSSSLPGARPTTSTPADNWMQETEEKQMILDSLRRQAMNKSKVADDLGISLRTLYTRMEKLGIPKKKALLSKYLGM